MNAHPDTGSSGCFLQRLGDFQERRGPAPPDLSEKTSKHASPVGKRTQFAFGLGETELNLFRGRFPADFCNLFALVVNAAAWSNQRCR